MKNTFDVFMLALEISTKCVALCHFYFCANMLQTLDLIMQLFQR